jgi:hypothetical protein
VDHASVERRRKQFAIQLLRQISMQSAREHEDKCHDMRADMVIENLAEICHTRRVRNQLRVVPARRRSRLGGLDPAQLGSFSQKGRGDSAKRCIRPCDGARGFGLILGDDDGHVGCAAARRFAHSAWSKFAAEASAKARSLAGDTTRFQRTCVTYE